MEEKRRFWLLRIEHTIYGPFETQKVVDLITKGRVSEIDEAALPRDRWNYVRDLQEFMRAVELQRKISSRKKVREESISTTSTEAVARDSSEQTRELTGLDVMTNTLPIPNISREELMAIGDSERGRPSPHQSYGFSSPRPQKKFKNLIFGIVGVVAFMVALSFTFKDQLLHMIDSGRSVLSNEDPLESWNQGDYKKAFEVFKRKTSLQTQYPIKYAALILKNTQDPMNAKIWLEKASVVQKNSNTWVNLNAVTYMHEENFAEAEAFLKSIDHSSGELGLESLYNLAALHHLQKDWTESKILFESIYAQDTQGQLDGASLYLIDAWIQSLIQSNARSDEYEKVSSFINNILNSESLYSYDVTFIAFWLIQSGKVKASTFSNLEEKVLSYDPEVVFNRISSPYVYDFLGQRIKEYCASLVGVKRFVQLSCQMTSLRRDLKLMRLPDSPEGDSNQLALYSFIFDKRGDSFKANEFLIESFERTDNARQPLRFYVQARFCQVNGNYKCAVENWSRALDINSFAPTALVGLSEAYLDKGEVSKAKNLYNKSMQFSKDLVSYQRLSSRIQDK